MHFKKLHANPMQLIMNAFSFNLGNKYLRNEWLNSVQDLAETVVITDSRDIIWVIQCNKRKCRIDKPEAVNK